MGLRVRGNEDTNCIRLVHGRVQLMDSSVTVTNICVLEQFGIT
jgi:hypothetical protein